MNLNYLFLLSRIYPKWSVHLHAGVIFLQCMLWFSLGMLHSIFIWNGWIVSAFCEEDPLKSCLSNLYFLPCLFPELTFPFLSMVIPGSHSTSNSQYPIPNTPFSLPCFYQWLIVTLTYKLVQLNIAYDLLCTSYKLVTVNGLFLFFFGCKIWTQGFALVSQTLYHLSHISSHGPILR
jgi:hypothetical protein